MATRHSTSNVQNSRFFRVSRLHVQGLSPLMVMNIPKGRSTKVNIRHLFFQAFRLRVRRVRPIVSIHPSASPFNSIQLSRTYTNRRANRLASRIASNVRHVRVQSMRTKRAENNQTFLFLLTPTIPLRALLRDHNRVSRQKALRHRPYRPLNVFPGDLLHLILFILIVRFSSLHVSQLRPSPLSMKLRRINRRLNALSLIVLPRDICRLSNIMVLVRNLYRRNVQQQYLMYLRICNCHLLCLLRQAIQRMFLARVPN